MALLPAGWCWWSCWVRCSYLWERQQFGQYIGDFQGMEMQYAEVQMEIEAARMLVYNAARLKEAGEPFVIEVTLGSTRVWY